jgi:site-specific recombinase XerD
MGTLHKAPEFRRLPVLGPYSQRLVTEYLAFLTARHYAPATIQTTIDTIKSFCILVPAARHPALSQDLTRTTPEDVDAWLQAAYAKGLAPSTINNIVGALHRFFAFLHEQGKMPQQPIHWRRHRVLAPQPLPRPVLEEDLGPLFKVIDSVRDRTMFLLMLRCGLRVAEVSVLTWSAIDASTGSIRIDTSKGQVDRVVYYSPDVAHALRQWRHLQSPMGTYVFPSPRTLGTPLSVRAIQYRMAHYLKVAHITNPYSPHSLRHTFATQLLNAGAGLEVVKELMGHQSISMTLRYTQLYEATKRRQYDQAMAQIEKRHEILER